MDTRQNTLRTLSDSALDELANELRYRRNGTDRYKLQRLLVVERERRRRLQERIRRS